MSLWLGVLVPGHQQHWVALPGEEVGDVHAGIAGDADYDKDDDRHHPHDESRCAVCLFASSMSAAPQIDLHLTDHQLVSLATGIEPEQWIGAERIFTFHGRAPPFPA